jgi:hypothetical protein
MANALAFGQETETVRKKLLNLVLKWGGEERGEAEFQPRRKKK